MIVPTITRSPDIGLVGKTGKVANKSDLAKASSCRNQSLYKKQSTTSFREIFTSSNRSETYCFKGTTNDLNKLAVIFADVEY